MRDAAERAAQAGAGLAGTEIAANEMLSAALTRWLELIGEAANRIPAERQAAHPQVPWRELIGLRNVLIHQYDRVNYDFIARIVNEDLPPLIAQLRAIIEQETP